MTPNTTYGGPHATKVSVLQAVPFTSDTAELNAVKAGKVDLGYVPLRRHSADVQPDRDL